MHLCYICHEYPPGQHGGVGSFVRTLGRAMAARGHRVTVVGCYPVARDLVEDDHGVHILRLARTRVPKAGFFLNGRRLRRALGRLQREHPIDILEGSELNLAMVPKRFPAVKLIRMHGGHHYFAVTLGAKTGAWRAWQERRSFARADRLCGVSRFVAETTRKLLALGDRPIEILHNPVDVARFAPRPDIAVEPGLLTFVGTICEKKGVRQLVQAMPRIVGAAPRAKLWIVGRDWRDPGTGASYSEGLKRQIPAELADRIVFKGPAAHAEIPEILARAELCLYPSHMEAMPIAWLEGMAMGKPVVASRAGPGPEAIEHGVDGLLCDPHDPASIAEQVIAALADAGLRARLGRQARETAVRRFSIDTLAAKNEAYYQRCLSGS